MHYYPLHYSLHRFDRSLRKMFIEDIFRELRNWTSEIVEKFEFPAGYPEWTMAGHLALAAYKAGFPYILQDYIVPKEELCHSKQQSRRTRPDLYIQNRDLECLIELKRCNIDLEGVSFQTMKYPIS
jgi:hypothetical protein